MEKYTLKLETPWEETKEKLKEVNYELTDDDLAFQPGQEKEMLERVSRRIGKNIEETKAWIESVSFNKGKAS